MWTTIVALALLLPPVAVLVDPQTPQPAAPSLDPETIKSQATEPGVYVVVAQAAPSLVRLTGSVSDGVKTSTGLGGMVRMKSMLKLIVKEGRAPVRLSDQPVIVFVGKAPGLYHLVRLAAKNKTREMNLGEIRTVFDSISSDFPDRIPLSVIQVAEQIHQATVTSPLEPGEYAVVDKTIVAALSSSDRKAGGPFVLGLGVDGKPGKGR